MTVAPAAYDENDIFTHIFWVDRCFTWVQKATPVGAAQELGCWARRANTDCTGISGRSSSLYSAVQCSKSVSSQIIMGASSATMKKMSALAPSLVASTCQAPCVSRSTFGAGLPPSSTSLMMQNDGARLVTGSAWGSTTAGPIVQAAAPALAHLSIYRRA